MNRYEFDEMIDARIDDECEKIYDSIRDLMQIHLRDEMRECVIESRELRIAIACNIHDEFDFMNNECESCDAKYQNEFNLQMMRIAMRIKNDAQMIIDNEMRGD